MTDYEEFSTTRPKKKGKVVMCVPYAFKTVDGKDGRKAVPVMPRNPGMFVTRSGYLAFSSVEEAQELLKELETVFKRNGIGNFAEIRKAAEMSKAMIANARLVTDPRRKADGKLTGFGGKFTCDTCIIVGGKSIPFTAKSVNDLIHSDWAGNLRLTETNASRQGMKERGIIEAKGLEESRDEGMVRFTYPGSNIDMKVSVSLLQDYESYFGREIKSTTCASRGFTYVKPKTKAVMREADSK